MISSHWGPTCISSLKAASQVQMSHGSQASKVKKMGVSDSGDSGAASQLETQQPCHVIGHQGYSPLGQGHAASQPQAGKGC